MYTEYSHRRLNILTNEWVQVSPHRAKRPWQGQVEELNVPDLPEYDENCYLCPGNERANGQVNPNYQDVFVFNNDFAALQEDIPASKQRKGFFQHKSERGICRVVCFSPKHNVTIPEMEPEAIQKVIRTWMDEVEDLGKKEFIHHVQVFENKGSIMGCSNPHPHSQIWSQESVPDIPKKKTKSQEAYYLEHHSTLLEDYLKEELKLGERIIYENAHFVVLTPYWAIWPYEAMILPKRAMAKITEMSEAEVQDFADAYKVLTVKYDNLFRTSFPYSAGIHQAPTDGKQHPAWHWHMSFYPPLLRSATVKKFMVGYEMLATPQRDFPIEQAAETLRNLPVEHYKLSMVL